MPPFCNPLPTMRPRGLSSDSDSFRSIDLESEMQLPLAPHCGAFAVRRSKHTHEGVDLYAPHGTPVAAVEAGTVLRVVNFTGEKAGSPWWLDTQALMVASEAHVVNYGEIAVREGLEPGARVAAGEILGTISTVLAVDKGRPRAMLHFEMYAAGYDGPPAEWDPPDTPRPAALIDPTPYLRHLFEVPTTVPSSVWGTAVVPPRPQQRRWEAP